MPQMSPLMWGLLILMFSFLMMVTIIKIYFSYYKTSSMNILNHLIKTSTSMNWLW